MNDNTETAGATFAGQRIAELTRQRDALLAALRDAAGRLQEWIGADCECDNTHAANRVTCCLCEYRAAIAMCEKGAAP